MTKADAWVTVAVLVAVVLLSLGTIYAVVTVGLNSSASPVISLLLASTAPTVVTLLNFVNSRNTARKVDNLTATANKIDTQTNGGLGKNVEDAADRAVERALTRILNGHTRRSADNPDRVPPGYD